jgi:hypothetical protein
VCQQQPERTTSPPANDEMKTSSSGGLIANGSAYISSIGMTNKRSIPWAIGWSGWTTLTTAGQPSSRQPAIAPRWPSTWWNGRAPIDEWIGM